MFREIHPSASGPTPHKRNEQDDQRTAPPKRTITSLACTLCRQRRVKCDGKRPSCSACIVKGKDNCEYDIGRAQRRTGVLQNRIQELESEISTLRHHGRSSSFGASDVSPTSPHGTHASVVSSSSDDFDLYGAGGDDRQLEGSSVAASASRDAITNISASTSSWTSFSPKRRDSSFKKPEVTPRRRGMTDIEPSLARHAREQQRQVRYRYRPAGDGMNVHLFGDMSTLGIPNTTPSGEAALQGTASGVQRILVPFFLVQSLTYTDNQVLSRAYSSFLIHQRHEVANGAPVEALIGKGHVDVSALIGEDGLNTADPVSRFIASLLSTFGLTSLPEKLGIMHLLYVLLRWQINPTAETYKDVPISLKPSAQQRLIPHPAWIDLVIWPDIRDTFIMYPGILSGDGVECFPILMETACVGWPLAEAEMTRLDAVTGRLVLTSAFVTHCEDINNWSVGSALISKIPALVDKVWVQDV